MFFFILETCPNRPAPDNGDYVGGSRTAYFAGDLATFICTSGYELSGSASSRCQSSGSWRTDVPVCRRKFYFVILHNSYDHMDAKWNIYMQFCYSSS